MKKSKILVPLFAATLLFTACAPTSNSGNGPFAPGKAPAANLYAFQAATSIGLIGNISTNTTGPRMARSAEETQSMINEIINYLPSAEAALAGLDTLTSAKETTSDREGYASKLTISYKDIALADNTFTMYYNETNLDGTPIVPETNTDTSSSVEGETTPDQATTDTDTSSKTSETAPDAGQLDEVITDEASDIAPKGANPLKPKENEPLLKDDSDDDEDEEESEDSEKETKITGIIVMGETEYEMTGSREIDPVDNEMETSFEYHIDETTLVTVEQEIENGETSFEYEIEADGETIYEYSIEIQNDEVELEVEKAGVAEREYTFSLTEKDGKQVIKADYESENGEETFLFEKIVNSEDGTVKYQIIA